MRKACLYFLTLCIISVSSCAKTETKIDTAINVVKVEYGDTRLNFDKAKLDSLYNISPAAYADSIKVGKNLDEKLAEAESQIEHLPQAASDSVGLISARLTKQRYRLLNLEKTKPKFIGWKLSGVQVLGNNQKVLDFNLDTAITKIVK